MLNIIPLNIILLSIISFGHKALLQAFQAWFYQTLHEISAA